MIIETKVLGSRRRPFEPWEIHPFNADASSETVSLRAFLTRLVKQEAEAFMLRQAERKLARVLSDEDMQTGRKLGKFTPGERETIQDVDVQAAIDTALLAFEDGFYYVFVDGEKLEQLDAAIMLYSHSRVLFVRLVPLVGG